MLSKELQQRPGVRVRAGHRVLEVRMEENRNEAVVRTTDGDLRADLVVGADGYGSIVRRFVAPEHPHATYSGYLLWRGLIDERQVPGGSRIAGGAGRRPRTLMNEDAQRYGSPGPLPSAREHKRNANGAGQTKQLL